eukprot:1181833-Prorocentrum_minimum.AAC.1
MKLRRITLTCGIQHSTVTVQLQYGTVTIAGHSTDRCYTMYSQAPSSRRVPPVYRRISPEREPTARVEREYTWGESQSCLVEREYTWGESQSCLVEREYTRGARARSTKGSGAFFLKGTVYEGSSAPGADQRIRGCNRSR